MTLKVASQMTTDADCVKNGSCLWKMDGWMFAMLKQGFKFLPGDEDKIGKDYQDIYFGADELNVRLLTTGKVVEKEC